MDDGGLTLTFSLVVEVLVLVAVVVLVVEVVCWVEGEEGRVDLACNLTFAYAFQCTFRLDMGEWGKTHKDIRISDNSGQSLTSHSDPETLPNGQSTQLSRCPTRSSEDQPLDPFKYPISDGRINGEH